MLVEYGDGVVMKMFLRDDKSRPDDGISHERPSR
jgi:hypothetical protein